MATQSATDTHQIQDEPTRGAETGRTTLPLDIVFGTLSNERRRRTLRYLYGEPGEERTTLGDLAEHIASIENDKPREALSSSERKRVYICLYQCHLPKMDDADIIAFDEHRKTVEPAENAADVLEYLPPEDDGDSPRSGLRWSGTVGRLARAVDRRLRTLG